MAPEIHRYPATYIQDSIDFRVVLGELKSSDFVVFNMDGRFPDEGACVEIGIGYALGKECVGLKTDVRVAFDGTDNPMILVACGFEL
jgi:nucleoside 2-deoxyribosyltransferase